MSNSDCTGQVTKKRTFRRSGTSAIRRGTSASREQQETTNEEDSENEDFGEP